LQSTCTLAQAAPSIKHCCVEEGEEMKQTKKEAHIIHPTSQLMKRICNLYTRSNIIVAVLGQGIRERKTRLAITATEAKGVYVDVMKSIVLRRGLGYLYKCE
jgi:hypothetical protein